MGGGCCYCEQFRPGETRAVLAFTLSLFALYARLLCLFTSRLVIIHTLGHITLVRVSITCTCIVYLKPSRILRRWRHCLFFSGSYGGIILPVLVTLVLGGNGEARHDYWYSTTVHIRAPPDQMLSILKRLYPYHPFFPVIFVTPESLERAGTIHSVISNTSMAR